MINDCRSEREKAAYGPRSLKQPGSPEWCWQTLDALVADYKLIDERFDEVGGALAQLKEVQAWKVIPTDKPYGSLGRMLAQELGVDSKSIQHEIMQARKRRKLGKRGRPIGGGGASHNQSEEKGVNHTLTRGTGNRAYILARLDRDGHDELAVKVRANEMSAKAAASEAKLGKQRECKQLTPLERVRKLYPKLTRTELRQVRHDVDKLLKS